MSCAGLIVLTILVLQYALAELKENGLVFEDLRRMSKRSIRKNRMSFNQSIGRQSILERLISSVMSLRCYHCTIRPPSPQSNETTRLCSHFDGSSLYEVNCPYSTFCLKKSFELSLLKGKVVKGIERMCAPQLYNYQTYDGTQWRMKNSIEDTAYVEGCFPTETQGVKSPSTEHCYCKGNLCNSAKPTREASHHHTDAMAVIFVFNAMKYIRSLR